MIDGEVQHIVTDAYARAYRSLQAHRDALERLTGLLLEKETVDGSAVKHALADSGDAQTAA